VDLTTFNVKAIEQGNDDQESISYIASGRYLFVRNHIFCKIQGYRVEQSHLTPIWTKSLIKSTSFVGANNYCLVCKNEDRFGEKFDILATTSGKIIKTIYTNKLFKKVYVTQQLICVYCKNPDAILERKPKAFLDIYLSPLGKKLVSYPLSSLCEDFNFININEIADIETIAFENDQLTIVYKTKENLIRALVVSLPENAILDPQQPVVHWSINTFRWLLGYISKDSRL
jgi:hypothetical protein